MAPQKTTPTLPTILTHSLLASLGGGLIFGALMSMMGMLPMLASMVGSSSTVIGFAVHMMISAIFGLVFGLLLSLSGQGHRASTLPGALVLGLTWGSKRTYPNHQSPNRCRKVSLGTRTRI